jgi:hypothetical protein
MSEGFKAVTQYSDFRGTAAFDGHDHAVLDTLARHVAMQPGFLPVGFEIGRLEPSRHGKVHIYIVAVFAEAVGKSLDAIRAHGKAKGKVPLYRFSGEIDADTLWKVFKRVNIRAVRKQLAECTFQVFEAPEE